MIRQAIIVFLSVAVFVQGAVPSDLVTRVPGYGDSFKTGVYAGYLNTSSSERRLHYVFVEHEKGANNTEPLTLWLNGGPGCSSLLGFLQEIGPYYLQEGINYTIGDNLTENNYSWHKHSNLLFIESPAGVGYSINTNSSFVYNDLSTMNDNFQALQYFLTYYPQYKTNKFWIAGQSYAGKYIPDLAFRIDHFNQDHSTPNQSKINLKGLLIGNGVIDFRDDSLLKSQVQYMLNRDFVDPNILQYWQYSCLVDEQSAGCRFFYDKYYDDVEQINPYSVYSYCYYNGTSQFDSDGNKKQFLNQQSILLSLTSSMKKQNGKAEKKGFNGAPCAYFDGMYQYFNAHVSDFHGQSGMKWNGPCAEDISKAYLIDSSGSTHQLSYLLSRQNIHTIMYNGDWDGVVPYIDTIKNLQKLGMEEVYLYKPQFLNGQHYGFVQLYSGLPFMLIKGASHQVPQSKRQVAQYIFSVALESHQKLYNP